jgi:two-component system, chemotaxis family, sensor kinase CheA
VTDTLDLNQFHDVFFDEALEHLGEMEGLLLHIDVSRADSELLNAIFRAAHSIKGGAAMFGFTDITELTHEMETVFDKVRKGEIPLTDDLINALLDSRDTLKGMLDFRRNGGEAVDAHHVQALCHRLRAFVAAKEAPAPNKPVPVLELVFGPFTAAFTAASIDAIIADLYDFGPCEEVPVASADERRFRIRTSVSESDLGDVLAFMLAPEQFRIKAATAQASSATAAVASVATPPGLEDVAEEFGKFANAPVGRTKAVTMTPAGDTSIRVPTQKIDQIINMVGELVITHAMLVQSAAGIDPVAFERLQSGFGQLKRNASDLQEATMSMRMMPMSLVFLRFKRLVHDVAAKLGKEVELVTLCEDAELDKGLIERLVDPLTHLVRNSLDHGLETPGEREAAGKPRKGTITLNAHHLGHNIVIGITDDGRGLQRDKILAKARERSIPVSDNMPDSSVWGLIFEAGFSTADVVTDVSGRGVGMDVVRRNILDMGGRVEIDSSAGVGTRITIKLPLTLAILDGMSIRAGSEIYILPLVTVAEALQPAPGAIRTINGNERVIQVRGEYLPVVALHEVFNIGYESASLEEEGIVVILETEGGRTALLVDDLVGQHQVVIKNLEANYRKVAGVSGATIMGDGRVALILDTRFLVGLARSRMVKAA